jgi:N-methylhydantoinase B
VSDFKSDLFTREIVKDGLLAAAEESFIAQGRTSKSTIIYEVLDYACGLTNPDAELVAIAHGVPGFIGLLSFNVAEALAKVGRHRFKEGDIVLSNIPYTSGTHLSDVAMCMPIYYDGELVAFSSNKAHWTEVGGKDPGSWTTDATEIYQEGLQFPAIKLYAEGEPNQAVIDIISANVRLPEMTLGDMYAQAASLRVASRRVAELCRKYRLEVVKETMAWYLDYGERLAQQELGKLPKGVFEAEDWIDSDGLTNDPIRVKVKVTITENEFEIDYTGTDPQTKGPVNCTLPATTCSARKVFLGVTDPHLAMNDGYFRPLKVIAPQGTVFNATHPAPTSIYWDSMIFAEDLVCKALAPQVPYRLTAGHFLSTCGIVLSGERDESHKPFILVEPQAGGWGAGSNRDGEGGLVASSDGDTFVIPVEVCEQRYPVMVEQFSYNLEEGGQGEFRGGKGLVRDYRIRAAKAFLTGTFGRFKFPPWGVAGGLSGTRNRAELFVQGRHEPETRGKVARFPLKDGDLVRLITATGGGWGQPLERAPSLVLNDVRDGFMTREQARSAYGVVLDVTGNGVDMDTTMQLRAQLKQSRYPDGGA